MRVVDKKHADGASALTAFNACTREWFQTSFDAPTLVQAQAWPHIQAGRSTLLFAPTGSGKTLAAFLCALDGLMFGPTEPGSEGVDVIYLSPLKALGVDVDRNLRAPLAGISAAAARVGAAHWVPEVGIRSGDTPSRERARMVRRPPSILITTPESLFLLLTSRAKEILQRTRLVIIDEIHAMVTGKRGAHLFVTLERLERLRRHAGTATPMQRIGLSATQRPLDEVATLLAGAEAPVEPELPVNPRHVEIVNADAPRPIELTVTMALESLVPEDAQHAIGGNAAVTGVAPSIWPAILPRLTALIRAHRSTMVFVNSRRLAERLALAVNEQAEEELAEAHHGSIAKETRAEIEDRLKRGELPAIVATSSLELGVDMGAVDLVVQVEAPPSIAAGLQRIGRSGHSVGATPRGVIFPKYRGDLLAAAASAKAMLARRVEARRFPRNPLDVLAQQVVAMVAMEDWSSTELLQTLRQAAPFAGLSRDIFDSVLDMLAGRYPSEAFAELRPRLNWDRVNDTLSARRGAQRVAIVNAGTITDRGLYGVFLLREDGAAKSRVGELDEEMVFELQTGDVFRLGASTWRTLEITHDQVLVEPAPGEPAKMPFWRGDGLGRPLEFGRAIGALTRKLAGSSLPEAQALLTREHALESDAAATLANYVQDQVQATVHVPSDEAILIETFVDEIGDWRVVILSPFGVPVHAPWATAVARQLRAEYLDVDVVWTDDGIVFRLPESDSPPTAESLIPDLDTLENDLVSAVADTALFAARFRENAARSLLLPRRRPDQRTPLWLQRRKAADLLAVASQYDRFPVILETVRELFKDVFDLAGLKQILGEIQSRKVRVHVIDRDRPSPFAQAVLFDFTANFIYEGDSPLAERRAQALALDHGQLQEILGSADYRELLDPDAVEAVHLRVQRLSDLVLKDADDLHDLLRAVGDLSREEISVRATTSDVSPQCLDTWLQQLEDARRLLPVRIAEAVRYITVEDAARYRDGLGVVLPQGLPSSLLDGVPKAVTELVTRFARCHGPFQPQDVTERLGLPLQIVRRELAELRRTGAVYEGEFTARGGIEWIEKDILRQVKRRSLARWRKQIEPVEPRRFAAFLPHWHGLDEPRRGVDGVYDVVQQLQGVPVLASELETQVLPARVANYRVGMLDELCVAGEVIWRGLASHGSNDGRIALYLTDDYPLLAPAAGEPEGELAQRLLAVVEAHSAVFFSDLVQQVPGFQPDIVEALWDLVWLGRVTNDSVAVLRDRMRSTSARKPSASRRSRRPRPPHRVVTPPGTGGRWSRFERGRWTTPTPTEQRTAQVQQLLERHGMVTRESLRGEWPAGGFGAVYPILRAMEESGKVRRGYFIEGLGASQFALPGVEDRLREHQDNGADHRGIALVLAATDPANAYGQVIPWPETAGNRCKRVAGARVILADGALVGYLGKSARHLLTFLPEAEPERSAAIDSLVHALAEFAQHGETVLLEQVDETPVAVSAIVSQLEAVGFVAGHRGHLLKPASKRVRRAGR